MLAKPRLFLILFSVSPSDDPCHVLIRLLIDDSKSRKAADSLSKIKLASLKVECSWKFLLNTVSRNHGVTSTAAFSSQTLTTFRSQFPPEPR